MMHINYTLIQIFEYCIFKFDVNLIKQMYTVDKNKSQDYMPVGMLDCSRYQKLSKLKFLNINVSTKESVNYDSQQ